MSVQTVDINVVALSQHYQDVKDAERKRNEFIETLMLDIQALSRERDENIKALRAQQMLVNTYQDRFENAEKQVSQLRKAIDCDKFVLLLIDGDNTLFKDDYVKGSIQGGERAARDLHEASFDYFNDKSYFKHDYKIVTKIYINLAGLSKTYREANITSNQNRFLSFVQGFNKTHTLMEIVDAGNGKEGADSKLHAEFELFRRNLQCTHIAIAGSGDNSYARFLRPYAPNNGKSETITLIKALPFAHEMYLISHKFDTVSFDSLFRSTKINNRRSSSYQDFYEGLNSKTPSPPPLGPPATSSTVHGDDLLSATATPKVDSIVNSDAITRDESLSNSTGESSSVIYVNIHDERIDVPFISRDPVLVKKLKDRKLCNKHYLSKGCLKRAKCQHDHESVLSLIELENLPFVARRKRCLRGLKCRDPDCCDGHQCQQGATCINLRLKKCFFDDAMHKVNKENIKLIRIPTVK